MSRLLLARGAQRPLKARAGLLLPRRCGREGAGRPPPREKAAALIYEVLASTKNEALRRGQDTGAAARGWSRKGRGGPSLNGDQEIETVIKEKRCGPAPAPAHGWGRPAGGERSAHHPARPQASPTVPPAGSGEPGGWRAGRGPQVRRSPEPGDILPRGGELNVSHVRPVADVTPFTPKR